MSYSVYDSVYDANRQRGSAAKRIGVTCPCGLDSWTIRNGVDARYASEYNPGEFVRFTCSECGNSFEEQS